MNCCVHHVNVIYEHNLLVGVRTARALKCTYILARWVTRLTVHCPCHCVLLPWLSTFTSWTCPGCKTCWWPVHRIHNHYMLIGVLTYPLNLKNYTTTFVSHCKLSIFQISMVYIIHISLPPPLFTFRHTVIFLSLHHFLFPAIAQGSILIS